MAVREAQQMDTGRARRHDCATVCLCPHAQPEFPTLTRPRTPACGMVPPTVDFPTSKISKQSSTDMTPG